jgi:hypothetical protein
VNAIFGETPAISEIVAAVWRKSYSRTGGNSADLSNIDLFVYTNQKATGAETRYHAVWTVAEVLDQRSADGS